MKIEVNKKEFDIIMESIALWICDYATSKNPMEEQRKLYRKLKRLKDEE